MSVWKIAIQVLLPVPLVLVIALLAPAPRSVRRGVLRAVDLTLGIKFVGFLSLLHFALLITGAAFLNTVRETYFLDAKASERHNDVDVSPNVAFSQLGKKWRAERNFWISFVCFFLWLLLARLYQLVRKHEDLIDQVGSVNGAPTRPATRSPKKAA